MNLSDSLSYWAKFNSQTVEEDARVLYQAVLDSPPGAVVEVGSACGGTTVVLIGAAEEVGKMVYSIDPYPVELEGNAVHYTKGLMNSFKEKFHQNILEGPWKNIIQYNEDLTQCIDRIPNELSVAFVDGCHEFSFVQSEVYLLYTRVVPGGYLFVHDFSWSFGQISKTTETGLLEIAKWMSGVGVVDILKTAGDSMLICKRR